MVQVNDIKPKGSRIANIFIFIGFMIIVSSPMIFLGTMINVIANQGSVWTVLIIALITVIWTVLLIWLIRWYYQKRSYEIHKQKFTFRDVLINILFFIGMRIVIYLFTVLMQSMFNEKQSANDQALVNQFQELKYLSFSSVLAIVFFLIILTFIAPYLEELVFRGIFKETIFKKSAFLIPLIISSAVFSSLHASTNWISFFMYMALGIILYLAYNRRGNIKDSMMVHMLNNGFAGVTMMIMVFT